MRTVLITLIKAYQLLISPYIPSGCRYTPTCSCYAQQSLQQHGVFKGGWLAVKRIVRCHPWHEGGFDPVPTKTKNDTVRPCRSHTHLAGDK